MKRPDLDPLFGKPVIVFLEGDKNPHYIFRGILLQENLCYYAHGWWDDEPKVTTTVFCDNPRDVVIPNPYFQQPY